MDVQISFIINVFADMKICSYLEGNCISQTDFCCRNGTTAKFNNLEYFVI